MAQGVLRRVWRVARWPLGAILILYIGLVIYRIPAVDEKMRTEEAVAKIHAQRLTLDDVTGKNLPPAPDPDLIDATVEGVDANKNGIRDDVELAIFKKYPNDAKIRAAVLQYAKELQMEFTHVFNSETLVAVIQEEGRGSFCLSNTSKKEEVKNLILNSDIRKRFREQIYQKYMTSYALLSTEESCDISALP